VPRSSAGAGRASASASYRFIYASDVGDAQRLSPEEQIRFAREAFEGAQDLTIAVEEEFQLLEPDTLELTNRFEELKDAAVGTDLDEHLVGELIASEIEIKTGRCATFAEAAERMATRRTQLSELADRHDVALACTGTHPWSRWQDQRIIDTPHYRRNNEILQYVVWRNNSFGMHVHIGIRGADRAIAVCNAFRNVLPELLALSASSPFVEDCVTGLHSARTEIFTRLFPRAGVPDVYDGWDGFERYVRFLYDTGSIDEHTQMWWSVRPHLAFPTVEIRICDAQPDLVEAQALAALMFALGARFARAVDEREPLPDLPNRLIEENIWRAIRYGLTDGLIDFDRGEVVPARARIETLIEWVLPVAEELGAAACLAVPDANSAERQYARLEQLGSHRDVFAELVRRPRELVVG
jgi:glutamate---cysteine ligase / carboxylate-amine ligase